MGRRAGNPSRSGPPVTSAAGEVLDHVAKGEELGYFQFGGSTHCLAFRPSAIADFTLEAIPNSMTPTHHWCSSDPKSATANTRS